MSNFIATMHFAGEGDLSDTGSTKVRQIKALRVLCPHLSLVQAKTTVERGEQRVVLTAEAVARIAYTGKVTRYIDGEAYHTPLSHYIYLSDVEEVTSDLVDLTGGAA